ncbi:hypothetical protein HFE02_25930 [Paenibacillus sp. EKM11P]|uniref:hypothetical protein n=1 Tax=unclassified Paenibacillus TaxID=185978 RepID=UPI00142DAAAD|nr:MULTISPECIES: hypothetical protein [unclassified Paenibacillus]KAF6614216.1 hypothetical protein HFE00_25840 [Paenibacillus sp. EKM101P]KAF6625052.1 hypothetical protein HFE01_26080 [Paenibacillus sp. EKM10P]KAF6640887.1 hypothetical protein HFE02_25930 [Paenibacillus sp. EKM11P]
MGQLTGAVARAIPPPPDWDSVADKIGFATVNHLRNYVGGVPEAPSQEEINQATTAPLPQLDISTREQDTLTPKVPGEFENGPIKFDIASTPAVETKDESKPFVLSDPKEGIDSVDIEKPKKMELEEPPVPKPIIFDIPKRETPPTTVEVPKPGKIIFDIPKPQSQTVDTPTPKGAEVEIPIPK